MVFITIITIGNVRLKNITQREVANEMETNINKTKTKGFNLITGDILKHLLSYGIVILSYLFIRLKHVPACWKVAEVIMLLKPG